MKKLAKRFISTSPLNQISNRVMLIRNTMSKPSSTMDELLNSKSLSNKPYSNCNTRIIDLKPLNVPDQATDTEYRQLYQTYIQSSNSDINARHLRDAIESIKYGIAPPVAFPTETVYGLGADATNEPAVAGIFAAKGRPSDNPLIVHVSSTEHLERVINEPLPEIYKSLVDKFWPGPLTILLPVPNASQFARNVYPGQKTIGFRMPSSKHARFFVAACDKPIAGPSANSSGKPSPTTAHHVKDDLDGKINFILDGGACHVGVESTVVDGICDPPVILRPGGVSRQELRGLGGRWDRTVNGFDTHESSHTSLMKQDQDQDQINGNGYAVEPNAAPRAPGMKYKHYSPTARLILFTPTAIANNQVRAEFDKLQKEEGKAGQIRIAFLDRTWGQYGGLGLTKPSANGQSQKEGQVQKDENRSLALSRIVDHNIRLKLGIDIDPEAWSPFTHQTSVLETGDKIVFNLSISERVHDQSSGTPAAIRNYNDSSSRDVNSYKGDHNRTSPTTTTFNPTSNSREHAANSNPKDTTKGMKHTNGVPPTNGTTPKKDIHASPGSRSITTLAQSLFAILRFFDALECDYIFAESVERNSRSNTNANSKSNTNINSKTNTSTNANTNASDPDPDPGLGSDEDEGDERVIDAVKDRLDKAAFERVEA